MEDVRSQLLIFEGSHSPEALRARIERPAWEYLVSPRARLVRRDLLVILSTDASRSERLEAARRLIEAVSNRPTHARYSKLVSDVIDSAIRNDATLARESAMFNENLLNTPWLGLDELEKLDLLQRAAPVNRQRHSQTVQLAMQIARDYPGMYDEELQVIVRSQIDQLKDAAKQSPVDETKFDTSSAILAEIFLYEHEDPFTLEFARAVALRERYQANAVFVPAVQRRMENLPFEILGEAQRRHDAMANTEFFDVYISDLLSEPLPKKVLSTLYTWSVGQLRHVRTVAGLTEDGHVAVVPASKRDRQLQAHWFGLADRLVGELKIAEHPDLEIFKWELQTFELSTPHEQAERAEALFRDFGMLELISQQSELQERIGMRLMEMGCVDKGVEILQFVRPELNDSTAADVVKALYSGQYALTAELMRDAPRPHTEAVATVVDLAARNPFVRRALEPAFDEQLTATTSDQFVLGTWQNRSVDASISAFRATHDFGDLSSEWQRIRSADPAVVEWLLQKEGLAALFHTQKLDHVQSQHAATMTIIELDGRTDLTPLEKMKLVGALNEGGYFSEAQEAIEAMTPAEREPHLLQIAEILIDDGCGYLGAKYAEEAIVNLPESSRLHDVGHRLAATGFSNSGDVKRAKQHVDAISGRPGVVEFRTMIENYEVAKAQEVVRSEVDRGRSEVLIDFAEAVCRVGDVTSVAHFVSSNTVDVSTLVTAGGSNLNRLRAGQLYGMRAFLAAASDNPKLGPVNRIRCALRSAQFEATAALDPRNGLETAMHLVHEFRNQLPADVGEVVRAGVEAVYEIRPTPEVQNAGQNLVAGVGRQNNGVQRPDRALPGMRL